MTGDTIAAIATAPGRGGVAVVRVSGSEAFAIGERLTGRVGIGKSRQASISVGPIYSASIDACRLLPMPTLPVSRSPIANASGPLTLTTATPPRPGAVAIAAMVSPEIT